MNLLWTEDQIGRHNKYSKADREPWTFGGLRPRSHWTPYLWLSRSHCSFQWCGLCLNYWQDYKWERRYFFAKLKPFPHFTFGKLEGRWVDPREPRLYS